MSIDSALATLAPHFGDRLARGEAVRAAHGRDEAHHPSAPPDAVLWPLDTTEVARVAAVCHAHGCPIVPWGTGTSLEGQVIPRRGGLSLDFGRMAAVLAVNPADMDAVVQPGLTRKGLNAGLRDLGLMFPIDPGADASLGGMAATRASGTAAVRYGTMRDAVLALEVVLADGRVIRTGSRARKSAAGYDLTRLMVGSEGTLGLITELTLRLHGVPEAMTAATCAFADIEGAVAAVIEIIQTGIPMARIELLDEVQVAACNAYSRLDLPVAPMLFLEFHGTAAAVAEQAARAGAIAAEHGAAGFAWAAAEEERARLWTARHNAYYAALALRPGARGYVTDACVPISRLAEAIALTKADLARTPLIAPLVGHVGDGNFHLCILVDPADPTEMAQAARIADRIAERALALGGTITGEHGIGFGKAKFMAAEHGDAWAVMGALKSALDPTGILNPGKLVPGNRGRAPAAPRVTDR